MRNAHPPTANWPQGLIAVVIFAVCLAFLIWPAMNPVSAAPPINDEFSGARLIPSLPFAETLDTTEATPGANDPIPSCYPSQYTSVWYAFTPPMNITLETHTQGSSYSTVLSVYTGTVGALNEVGCTRYSDPMHFKATAGETLYFMVSQITGPYPPPPGGAGGTLVFSVEQLPPPVNDDFINAKVVTETPFTESVDIRGATYESDEQVPTCVGAINPDKSIWYVFTPTVSGSLTVWDSAASFNYFLAAWTGNALADLNELACASNSSMMLSVQAGTPYYLQISNQFSGEGDTVAVNMELTLPPANDNFLSAKIVTELPYADSVNIAAASTEADEPQHCANKLQTVWYSFAPDRDLSIAAASSGSDYHGFQLAVYQAGGPGITDLIFLGCDPAPYGFAGVDLAAGTTYFFQVGTQNVSDLEIGINLREIFPPANDDFIGASVIAALPFTEQVDIRDASLEVNEPQVCGSLLQSAWYAYTPAQNVVLGVNTSGSSAAALVGIYQANGPGLGDLNSIGCVNAGIFNFNAQADFTYYFQVGRDVLGNTGLVQFSLSEIQPPGNDLFGSATLISSIPFSHTIDNSGATTESGEPVPTCVGSVSRSVWYAFTPVSSGSVTAQANEWWSFIAAYTGDSLESLAEVGCSAYNPLLPFQTQFGTTYYFQVGSHFFNTSGPLTYQLSETPPFTADFFWFPFEARAFENITFCDRSIDPVYAGFTSFAWDFGQGPITSIDNCVNHHFAAAGEYVVWHQATSSDGRTGVVTHTVQVLGPALPQCNGLSATVYVDGDGKVVGGPLNGQTYAGLLRGTAAADVIVGTASADQILAFGGDDVVCTLDGEDAIFGGAGADTAFGGEGNDGLFGGAGPDYLDGGAGQDLVNGGLGDDALFGGDQNDLVNGGPGDDTLDGGSGNDLCNGGAGTDTATNCEIPLLIP